MPVHELRISEHAKAACDDVCRIAARSAKAQIVLILEYSGKEGATIHGTVGSNVRRLLGDATIPGLHHDERPMVIFDDLTHATWFRGHPLRAIVPYATSMAAVSIGMNEQKTAAALVVLNPHPHTFRDAATTALLSELSRITSFILSGESMSGATPVPRISQDDLRTCGDVTGFKEKGMQQGAGPISDCDPLASFLLRTLVHRRSLRSRKSTHFVALRGWKQSVKDTQIAALRSLKSQLPPIAIAAIAEEIATAAKELYAGMAFVAVVPVPCGSSGHERCLSMLLAENVAKLLNLRCCIALASAASPGASHPRKSARLSSFEVREEVLGQVLLIDDVATTGTHIELAMRALRKMGASPLAIVWIGG